MYKDLESAPVGRQDVHRELFRNHVNNSTLHDIRSALNHELVLGSSYFKDKIEALTQRPVRERKAGGPKVE